MWVLRKFIEYTEDHMEETELWMLPYSTLMLTLVILFIMFYAFSSSNSVEYETALSNLASTNPDDPRVKQMKQEVALAKNIRDFIEKNKMTDKIQLVITPHAIKIKMESFALFDSGSAELKKDILFFLDHLQRQLAAHDQHRHRRRTYGQCPHPYAAVQFQLGAVVGQVLQRHLLLHQQRHGARTPRRSRPRRVPACLFERNGDRTGEEPPYRNHRGKGSQRVKKVLALVMLSTLFFASGAGAVTPKQVERIEQLKKDAVTLMREGKFEQAAPLLNEILAIDPLDKTAARYLALAKQRALEPYCREAADAFQDEDYAKAIEMWDKLLKMNPEDRRFASLIETTKNLITDKTTGEMYQRAEQFIKDGDYKSAVNELEKILAVKPYDRQARSLLISAKSNVSIPGPKSITIRQTLI